ncbi:MAG: hypothetical protein ACXWCZ_06730 [Flavisolibacter sp.]
MLKEGGKDKLTAETDADDMLIYGDSQGNKGRSLEAKSAVRVCVEKFEGGKTGNVNFQNRRTLKLQP